MLKLGALRKTKVWKEVYFSQQVIHSLKVIKCLDKCCWCRTACVLKKLNKKQLLSHGQNIIFRMILDLFWLLCSCASSMADFYSCHWQRLLDNTPVDHPDYVLLQQACRAMHELAMKIGTVTESQHEEDMQETLKKLELLLITDVSHADAAGFC